MGRRASSGKKKHKRKNAGTELVLERKKVASLQRDSVGGGEAELPESVIRAKGADCRSKPKAIE